MSNSSKGFPSIGSRRQRRKDLNEIVREYIVDKTRQKKPLNVITLGHTKSDNISQMIALIGYLNLLILSRFEA